MGGVVQRCLQRESGGGVDREISGSSSNDKHLSVIAVIGVGRVYKRYIHRELESCGKSELFESEGSCKLWKE